jgi:HemY protein
MKFGLLVLLVLAAGSVAAHFLLQDNGYVLIQFRGYAVEMSVPVLVFMLVVAYFAVRLLARIWRAPRDLGAAAARAGERRTRRRVSKGLAALADGKLARGERLLTRAADTSQAPALHYLEAARIAQMQGDPARRDEWLKLAAEQDRDSAHAVLLTRAELQFAAGDREAAAESLDSLLAARPKHPEGLRLLAELRLGNGDWPGVAELMPALRKLPSLSPALLDQWSVTAWQGLMADRQLDWARLDQLWQALPRHLRKDPDLVRGRLQALARMNNHSEVETEVRRVLKVGWDPALATLYADLELDDSSRQLTQLETWLRERPEDPDLLLAAGRVCMRRELWGKARSYLESSLAIRPEPAAYNTLGQLMLKIGESVAATEAFRKGLTMSYGAVPDVPQLQADPQPQTDAPKPAGAAGS